MVEIPQDIIDNIIEAVGNDRYFLKKCAVVSSSFLLPCRKYLFSKLSLKLDETCQKLHQFLVENPVVRSFVRSITIKLDRHYEWNHTSIIAILRLPFCCLESFSIDNSQWPQHQRSWNDDFSSELKDAILTIVHSSTLKTLYLCSVSVPIMLFLGINLSTLELDDFSPNDFDGVQSGVLTSEEVATTVVDRCVWRCIRRMRGTRFPSPAYFPLIWEMEDHTQPIFLPFMCRLRVLEIYIDPSSATMSDFGMLSFLIRSLLVSLTSPATLEHLKFDISFEPYAHRFYQDRALFFDDLRNAGVWSHLGSIITLPTGSRLQRVDIKIRFNFICNSEHDMYPDDSKVSKPVLNAVHDALPLLHEEGILFVEASSNAYVA